MSAAMTADDLVSLNARSVEEQLPAERSPRSGWRAKTWRDPRTGPGWCDGVIEWVTTRHLWGIEVPFLLQVRNEGPPRLPLPPSPLLG